MSENNNMGQVWRTIFKMDKAKFDPWSTHALRSCYKTKHNHIRHFDSPNCFWTKKFCQITMWHNGHYLVILLLKYISLHVFFFPKRFTSQCLNHNYYLLSIDIQFIIYEKITWVQYFWTNNFFIPILFSLF